MMKVKINIKKLNILDDFLNFISNLFGALIAFLFLIIISPFLFISKIFKHTNSRENNDTENQVEIFWTKVIENKSMKIEMLEIDECTFKLKSNPPIKELEKLEFITIEPYDLDSGFIKFHDGLYLSSVSEKNDEVLLFHLNIETLNLKLIHTSSSLISKTTIYKEKTVAKGQKGLDSFFSVIFLDSIF